MVRRKPTKCSGGETAMTCCASHGPAAFHHGPLLHSYRSRPFDHEKMLTTLLRICKTACKNTQSIHRAIKNETINQKQWNLKQ